MADTNPTTSPQASQKEQELEKKLSEIQLRRENERYQAKAEELGLSFVDLKTVPIDTEDVATLDESSAKSASAVVVSHKGTKLILAVLDPESPETKKLIQDLKNKGFEVKILITSPQSLTKVLEKYKEIKKTKTFEVGAIDVKEEELLNFENQINSVADLRNKINQFSTTQMLEVFIAGALKIGASDIHFEPEKEATRLRYRMDGVLNEIVDIQKEDYRKILNRVKVLSKLKLNLRNAQDGRFTIREKDVAIEVRVSVLPSEYGETIVMRLLDPRSIKQKLEELGMRDDFLKLCKDQLARSNGAILTTGPTGSGKTTTLYAFVNYLNSTETKIITIEDPIEYHIEGISQTQIEESKGYTFATGLRAIVRQDPDIILVGEIRDQETAEIALHAALTGHLVLSTLHTNNAAGTIPRLIDLGIKPQILAPGINMAMAQRLVRRLCPKCKKEEVIKPEDFKKLKGVLSPIKDRFDLSKLSPKMKVFMPGKCEECNELGYKGRVGIYEAFIITREMERLILSSPAMSDVEDLAASQGMVTMFQDAYLKVLDGLTSVEEVGRNLN